MENLSPFHLTQGKILRKKMTESMGVGFTPLHLIVFERISLSLSIRICMSSLIIYLFFCSRDKEPRQDGGGTLSQRRF